MGLTRERDVDDDPRPYVTGLREFAARNRVALADASLRYGRLWRQGIPYSTLHAQLHQPSRRPRHEALRRRLMETLSLNHDEPSFKSAPIRRPRNPKSEHHRSLPACQPEPSGWPLPPSPKVSQATPWPAWTS